MINYMINYVINYVVNYVVHCGSVCSALKMSSVRSMVLMDLHWYSVRMSHVWTPSAQFQKFYSLSQSPPDKFSTADTLNRLISVFLKYALIFMDLK